jgi:hypothetical protein
MRRQRMASSQSISIHSKVARPSGPAKLQVISQMPGAPWTRFTQALGPRCGWSVSEPLAGGLGIVVQHLQKPSPLPGSQPTPVAYE